MSDDTEDTEVEIPSNVAMPDLQPWEQHIWRTPGLSVEERQITILLIRLRRGVLDNLDGLRQLHGALGEILAKHDDDPATPAT